MEGYVFDIRHYSVHDGPGIRTAVFMKGCPLHCHWCHNPESQEMMPVEVVKSKSIGEKLIQMPESIGKKMSPEQVVQEVLKSRVFFEESGGGVTFTGGEPLMQPDFLLDTIKLMKQYNVHVALDTCG
jgi:pyruvate formate lyase activating enzyme